MPQSLAELRQILSRVKPWVWAASMIAVVLLGYFLVQGWRYWQASSDVSSLNSQIRKLDGNIKLLGEAGELAAAGAGTNSSNGQRSGEELRTLFSPRSAETLMARVAETALKAGVDLTAMTPGAQSPTVLGELQYEVQALSISLQGATTDLFRFLSLLQKKVPVVTASQFSISGVNVFTTAQIQLLFYFSPEPIEES